ncbi:50S ribosomal protein L22 [Candidatus Peregrinibacteria bacterium]|nr:50S ribosomal protein L22 [Candidatus Peregrinibacteria bacterium]
MKAYAHALRIAPKKANLIAKLVRGMPVHDAIDLLSRTHKKGARMVEILLKSAIANAQHNEKQTMSDLVIKTIVVNQGTSMRRGVPMARGRMRPMQKFMSHISIALGLRTEDSGQRAEAKSEKKASTKPKNAVQSVPKTKTDSSEVRSPKS